MVWLDLSWFDSYPHSGERLCDLRHLFQSTYWVEDFDGFIVHPIAALVVLGVWLCISKRKNRELRWKTQWGNPTGPTHLFWGHTGSMWPYLRAIAVVSHSSSLWRASLHVSVHIGRPALPSKLTVSAVLDETVTSPTAWILGLPGILSCPSSMGPDYQYLVDPAWDSLYLLCLPLPIFRP